MITASIIESLQEQLDDLRATGKTRIMRILNPRAARQVRENHDGSGAVQLAGGAASAARILVYLLPILC